MFHRCRTAHVPDRRRELLLWDGAGEVQYQGKRGHDGAARHGDALEGLDAAEFPARVLVSVPGEETPKGLSTARDGTVAVLKDGLQ